MKVLLATYWAYPHTGGVFTYLNILLSSLMERGHEVELLAQHPSLTKYYLLKNGLHIDKKHFLLIAEKEVKLRFKREQIKPTPWVLWRETEKLAFELVCRTLRLQHYDVIHTQDIISTFVCSRTKPAHVPLVSTIHGCLATEWIASNEMAARSQMEQEYLSIEEYYGAISADFLILPSHWLSTSLKAFQVHHPRSYVIPYGINQKEIEKISGASYAVNSIIVVCPARLVAIKGQTYLLKALRMLADVRSDIMCWLIGDGVMRHDLEQQAAVLGLQQHVKFWGNRHDVLQLISQADLVVLPSLQDNQPFSIIESQSLGKPVIASNVGGIMEMIEDGVNGQLVEPGNAQQLFEKLRLLMENTELRKKQSREAKNHALRIWNDALMLDQTLEIYQKSLFDGVYAPLWKEDYSSRLARAFQKPVDKQNEAHPRTIILRGNITESDMISAAGHVDVHLIDISGVVLRSTTTDQRGRFKFDSVQPGNYELGWIRGLNKMKTRKITVDMDPIIVHVMV